jgi:hypothetical protein
MHQQLKTLSYLLSLAGKAFGSRKRFGRGGVGRFQMFHTSTKWQCYGSLNADASILLTFSVLYPYNTNPPSIHLDIKPKE